MNSWLFALQATALTISLLWLLLTLAQRPSSALSVVWALFCGSIAMMLARQMVGPEAGAWFHLLGLGACLTCNGFWLVARALFRPGRPFSAPHLAYAGSVAVLIIVQQQQAISPAALTRVTAELLQLLSSAGLVLAFWEGLRGWSHQRGMERAMRALFMATYGGCVGLSLVGPALLSGGEQAQALSAALACAAILLVTQGLVSYRLRHPLTDVEPVMTPGPAVSSAHADSFALPADLAAPTEAVTDATTRAEDIALAAALEQHMRSQRPYLRAELRLCHLAQALNVGEYRVSRAINGPLRQRNVNHYINRYRLDHARAVLTDPACAHWSTLVVALESGFGSLGAFHRAFKAAENCTPADYRAARLAMGIEPIKAN